MVCTANASNLFCKNRPLRSLPPPFTAAACLRELSRTSNLTCMTGRNLVVCSGATPGTLQGETLRWREAIVCVRTCTFPNFKGGSLEHQRVHTNLAGSMTATCCAATCWHHLAEQKSTLVADTAYPLSVGLGDTLKLVLLLDSI